jgi:hypothetical protein
VLGVIFLRHATNRYDDASRQIAEEQVAGKMPKRPLVKQDFIRRRALMLPKEARYDELLKLPKGPNIAVVCDAEQIIHAHIDRANGNKVEYTMGAIEGPELNLHVINVLEGTRPAFDNRGSKYLPS